MASVVVAHFAAALALFYALAFRQQVVVVGVTIPCWAVVLLSCVALAGSMIHAARRELVKRSLQLVFADDGVVHVRRARGAQPCRVCGEAADFGWAIWMRLRPDETAADGGGSCWLPRRGVAPLMLVPDNLPSSDNWRTLRIWLRHKAFADRPTSV